MTPKSAKVVALDSMRKIEANAAAAEGKRDRMRQGLLSNVEAVEIVKALVRTRGARGIREDEIMAALNECVLIRLLASHVNLVAAGLMDVDINLAVPADERLVFINRKDIEEPLRAIMAERNRNEAATDIAA
jgi:hypothetical protein